MVPFLFLFVLRPTCDVTVIIIIHGLCPGCTQRFQRNYRLTGTDNGQIQRNTENNLYRTMVAVRKATGSLLWDCTSKTPQIPNASTCEMSNLDINPSWSVKLLARPSAGSRLRARIMTAGNGLLYIPGRSCRWNLSKLGVVSVGPVTPASERQSLARSSELWFPSRRYRWTEQERLFLCSTRGKCGAFEDEDVSLGLQMTTISIN